MSKNVGVFVDVANLYYAAKSANVDVDYVTLLKGAVKGRDLIRAYAYSGLDPENENQRKFIDFLSKNGYKVVYKDIRKYGDGKIKANLDIELVVDLFRLADRMDAAVIISGDGDFAPAIRALQDKGVRAEVISFRGNTSSDLIAVADEFIDIMKIVEVGRTKKDAVVPPAMPAKEVTPEFSFRDAPPDVVAAARAALRSPRTRRAPRRGEPPAVTAPAVGSEAEALAERGEVPFDEAELVPTAGEPSEGPARRRRGRRGGRGRGGATDGRPGDREQGLGIDPLDALESMDDGDDLADEGEYSFREADEATLAELGLEPPRDGGGGNGAAATALPTDVSSDDAPRKRTRRGRRGGRGRRRPDQDGPADAQGVGAAGDEPTSETSAVSDSPATVSAVTPRAPRTRRPRASAADASPAAGESIDASAQAPDRPVAPRGRRRTPAADQLAGAGSTGGAVRPRARRRSPTGAEAASEGEATRPAPRSRARRPAATPAAGADAGSSAQAGSAQGGDETKPRESQPRGIWQRLLSGRKD